MKILFFVGTFPKLSQTFILNQITGMIDAGHDVKVLAKYPADEQKVHDDVHRYGLMKRVIYYGGPHARGRLGKCFDFATSLSGIPAVRRSGLRFRQLLHAPNLILLARTLRQVDLTDQDVVIAHFGPNGLLAWRCMRMGLLSGRLLTAFHGYDMLRYVSDHGPHCYDELFKAPVTLLPISEFWKGRLMAMGADPDRLIVHHMGVDPEKFSASFHQPGDRFRLVSAARFVEKKGLAYAIAAVAALAGRGVHLRYDIAGDGPLRAALQQQIADLHMQDHVHLVGWKTQDEWIAMMRDADIVLAPSVTAENGDMEGIPVQLMEAMAMEKVVISTVHSGIPELIASGVNGWLVREKDADELAAAIERVIHASDHCRKLARRARRTVEDHFNIHLLNRQLGTLIERDGAREFIP
ncbi:MAG: glycosyltransferase [Sporolactobacillus sp.]|jgi:colanic acid/amylovoran biosynthesis glycosyltransferase|nr:glycosyltransferase [Sporolactobacillus sp.]